MGKRNPAVSAEEITTNISKTVKELRLARRYSLQELADRTGITKTHVWTIEQGKAANPSISTCVSLAGALGVSFEHLAGLTIKMPPLHPEALRIALEVDALLRKAAKKDLRP